MPRVSLRDAAGLEVAGQDVALAPPASPLPDPPFAALAAPGTNASPGNSPVKAGRFTAQRWIPDQPSRTDLRIVGLWLKAKGFKIVNGVNVEENPASDGYGAGHPRWKVAFYACEPTLGMPADLLGSWTSGDPATLPSTSPLLLRNMIPGGNVHVTGLSVPYGIPLWVWATELTTDGSYASVNLMRYDTVAGAPHMANDWTLKGTRSRMGLDYASVVYHYGYNTLPVWGRYSASLNTLPTLALELSDGTVEGQPCYDDRTAPAGPNVFTARRATTVTRLYSNAAGVVTANGQVVNVVAGFTNLTVPIALSAGGKLTVARVSGSFPSVAMDAVQYAAIGSRMQPATVGDGILAVGPA